MSIAELPQCDMLVVFRATIDHALPILRRGKVDPDDPSHSALLSTLIEVAEMYKYDVFDTRDRRRREDKWQRDLRILQEVKLRSALHEAGVALSGNQPYQAVAQKVIRGLRAVIDADTKRTNDMTYSARFWSEVREKLA